MGGGIIERLAHDLRVAFPSMKGFSRANLMYMRAFAEAWPEAAIVQQAVGQLPWVDILPGLKAGDSYGAQAGEDVKAGRVCRARRYLCDTARQFQRASHCVTV